MTPAQQAPQQKPPEPLPKLREELQIIAPRNSVAKRIWRIYDPVQHRYVEIDETTFKILSLWHDAKDGGALLRALKERYDLVIAPEEIGRLVEFAYVNHLTSQPPRGDWKSLARQSAKSRESIGQWLLHNYLFFKIPLFRPQGFLIATLPLVEPFFHKWFLVFSGLLGLIGLYLVSRQWDQFVHTFQHFFTLEGAAIFAVALFAVKGLHELGHAYTAARLGCQVPAIGLAFMMMTPMLYTDVTDAWRLRSRRQRMMIDIAGVAVELIVACFATFLWAFMPPGMGRSLAFVLATSSLLMSLVVNLSPFMRFDGYFILSDIVSIPNLQPRAFAVARWRLREMLFGLKAPCPENMSAGAIWAMVVYSWGTWIYRLGLYFGIAVVVYHYFFKLLGLGLFLVEVGFFIIRPLYMEVREWMKISPEIAKSRRFPVSAGLAALVVLLATIPWSTQVSIPVVVEPGELAHVFPKRSARVATVHAVQGDTVAAGKLLITLSSDELEHDIQVTNLNIQMLRARLARLTADDKDRENRLVSMGELASHSAKLRGLTKEKQELEIRSPIAGRIAELNPGLQAGRPVNAKELIALVSSETNYVGRGYIGESEIWRLSAGATGKIIPESIARPAYATKVSEISPNGAQTVDIADLASIYGGKIAVQPDAQHKLIPADAQYAVTLAVDGMKDKSDVRFRGVALIDGESESFAASLWRQVIKVLIRETGA